VIAHEGRPIRLSPLLGGEAGDSREDVSESFADLGGFASKGDTESGLGVELANFDVVRHEIKDSSGGETNVDTSEIARPRTVGRVESNPGDTGGRRG
jgi:hypothetical protein